MHASSSTCVRCAARPAYLIVGPVPPPPSMHPALSISFTCADPAGQLASLAGRLSGSQTTAAGADGRTTSTATPEAGMEAPGAALLREVREQQGGRGRATGENKREAHSPQMVGHS
ncbi:hypothetical protein CDD83_6856 [Cordyceps sp. RAO-2017]|nr:hypothetical protein CDD83_6856 [Cordyceps sp. RAO-2017]